MAKTAILAIRIISDATKAAKGFQQAESQTAKYERRLGTASKAAGAMLLGIGALGAKARTEASSLQQSSGAVEAAFGRQANAIKRASRSAAKDLGLAKSDYQQMAAVLGSQLRNLGVAQSQLVPTTKDLIKRGGDLAATFGGTTAEAVEALSSLMRGERDPIERYGVSIKQADINARLAAKGQDKLTGAAKKTAETEAVLAILTKQTAKAQGQRSREAGSDAQRAEIANAKMRNAFATLGRVVLPVTAAIAGGLASVADWVDRNNKAAIIILGTLAIVATTVLALNAGLKAYRAVTQAATVAQTLFNIAMKANPVVRIVTVVLLLAGALVLAYKKSETFRAIVQATGRAGKAAIGWVVDRARGLWSQLQKLGPAANRVKDIGVRAFKAYTAPIRSVINLVKSVVNWIRKIKFPKPPKWLGKVAGFVGLGGAPSTSPPSAGAGRRVPAGGRGGPGAGWMTDAVGGSSSGGNVYIRVDGALDPVAVAKQLVELLRQYGIRVGRPVINA